jgi:hypothetical protein
MNSQPPLQVGAVSSDGAFQWDGEQWQPLTRAHREPTSWTRPLQLVTAAYMLLGAVHSVVSTVLFLNTDSVIRAARAQNPALSDDQLRQAASIGVAVGWTTVVVLSLVMLFLALGSFIGWRWVFWVDLAWLALISIGVVTNLVALANPAAQSMPPGAIAISLVFSAAALALLAWFLLAAFRYGPWAMRKPGT